MTSGSAQLPLFWNLKVTNLQTVFQVWKRLCTRIPLASQEMSLHPKRAWPNGAHASVFPLFGVCAMLPWASMWLHRVIFFKNSSWFGKMICDLWTWEMLCFQRKGKWRHSQFYIENRCMVIPICEGNTAELGSGSGKMAHEHLNSLGS